jgi:hypothetical protein
MRCFNHNDVEAVAICPSCGKALCASCITGDGPECACSPECADYAAARRREFALLSKRQSKSTLAAEIGCYSSGALSTILGVVLGVFYDAFFLVWAVPFGLCLLLAGFLYGRARRLEPHG